VPIDLISLSTIASVEFADIVQTATIVSGKLRAVFILTFGGRKQYPADLLTIGSVGHNAPHTKWQHIGTFPLTFHFGTDANVIDSTPSFDPAVREFLDFARSILTQ